MPVVIVEMWEGRTEDQKRRLVKAITDSMVDIAKVGPDHLHVIIHEVPKGNWGRAGRLGSDWEPDVDKEKGAGVERLSHMALRVSDMKQAVRFYTEVVGLTVHSESKAGEPPLTVLSQGLGITTVGWEGGKGSGIDHLAFKVDSLEPLLARLEQWGAEIVDGPRPSPYGNSVYFLDPDGNKVECHDKERQS